MKELDSAYGICDMRQAPSPSNLPGNDGTANAVDDVDNCVAQMQRMMHSFLNSVGSLEYESAYGATSSPRSKSSGEIRKRQERKVQKKKEEDKVRQSSKWPTR